MAAQPVEAATAQAILNAARSRLLEDGYAGLSTRRIAQEAGVPLSQVHYHFGSKGGMVLALLEAENERRLSRQATLYSQDDTAVAPIRAGVRRVGGRPRVGVRPRPAGDDRRRMDEP